MLLSAIVIESEVSSSRRREKTMSFFRMTIFSTVSCGSTVSPVTLTSETLYCSPSVTSAVRYMSFLSGLIDTWVESMLKST